MSQYPLSSLTLPLEIWLLVTVACTLLLWTDAVLDVAGALVRRVSWRLHTRALLPLAASLLPGILALHIFDTMVYWTQQEVSAIQTGAVQNGSVPQDLVNNVAGAVGQVTLLGSIVVIVTGFALALGLRRLWPVRARQVQERL